jgi:glutaredoxin
LFEIYGRNNCVWCDRAKELLTSYGLEFEYANIEESEAARAEFKRLWPTARTVPQIIEWSDGDTIVLPVWTHIGGYEDLVKWLNKHYTKKS